MSQNRRIQSASLLLALAVVGLNAVPRTAAAQSTGKTTTEGSRLTDSVSARSALEFGVGFGPAVSIGLARDFDSGVGLFGAKLSWAWEENATTLESNVWEPFVLDLFYRRPITEHMHVDVGPTFMSFASHDDQGRDGRLLGVYASAWWGKIVYGGLEVRTGRLHTGNRSEFGAVVSFRIKVQIKV